MRGEFRGVWGESWGAIWFPLTESEFAPADIFCELYRELATCFSTPPSLEELADIIDDPTSSWKAFEESASVEFSNETALVRFFENAFEVIQDLQGDELSNLYFSLLANFVEKYSLGYSLRRPCSLSPTLPGMFADLASSLKRLADGDAHLAKLYRAHEESIRDLRFGATEERISTCINKQFMLLEAVASSTEAVTATTLGGMCDQLSAWPHVTIKESLKKLYGFACDYPGIRHGGNPAAQIRGIEARDLLALSILMMGYSPYLTESLDPNLPSLVEA